MQSYEFYIQTDKNDIDFINKVMEAYEGMGIVRTLDPNAGKVKIVTVDCWQRDVEIILNDMKENHNIRMEILKQGVWEGIL